MSPMSRNWCFRTAVKTLESPLDCKEIQPVHPKGNHSWIFIGRTDVEAETPILWPPDKKNWLTGKDPDAGKDSRQKEKRMTGWDGWMASPTRWTWVWASSRHWWWTGNTRMLQSMGSQKFDTTEPKWLNWTKLNHTSPSLCLQNALLEAFRNFRVFSRAWAMHLLAWLCDKAFSAPNSDDLASLCVKNWHLLHGSQSTWGILQVSQLPCLPY